MSSLEEWPSQRVVDGMIFCPFFFTFFFDFGSQIYTSPPTSDWHAPPSHITRCLPPLPPQALVVLVVCDRRVGPTRLGTLCSVVRVRATLRLFQVVLGGNQLYGVRSSSRWSWWRHVSFTHRRPASWHFLPLPAACFGFFCLCVFCVLLLFLQSQPTCTLIKFYGNICWLIARSALFL